MHSDARLPVNCSPVGSFGRYRLAAALRVFAAVGLLAMLSACAGGPGLKDARDTNYYRSHARSNYTPPGPPGDPWGPYIVQAAQRFDVPETWIREVMRAESGGQLFRNGQLITSGAGAMGLMQVMPGTYEELRDRHGLGDDPFDPKNNILAGTAYIREMYDIYGAPGFLAAYNAGPKRLDDYLANHRGLPDETRRYMAKIGPNIQGVYPSLRSQAEQYAMNSMPINVPPGLRYARGHRSTQVARVAEPPRGGTRGSIQVAQLTAPERATVASAPQAPAQASARSGGGFRLISSAIAAPVAVRGAGAGGGQWAVQVGAFSNQNLARMAVGSAKVKARDALRGADTQIAGVKQGRQTLYRARLGGLSQDAAMRACEQLQHARSTCVVISPDARS